MNNTCLFDICPRQSKPWVFITSERESENYITCNNCEVSANENCFFLEKVSGCLAFEDFTTGGLCLLEEEECLTM